jgi:hypothetical protein
MYRFISLIIQRAADFFFSRSTNKSYFGRLMVRKIYLEDEQCIQLYHEENTLHSKKKKSAARCIIKLINRYIRFAFPPFISMWRHFTI